MKCSVRGDNFPYILASAMKPGQIGRVFNHPVWKDTLVLRAYDSVIDLNCPSTTWGKCCSLEVVLLPKGSIVELTVE